MSDRVKLSRFAAHWLMMIYCEYMGVGSTKWMNRFTKDFYDWYGKSARDRTSLIFALMETASVRGAHLQWSGLRNIVQVEGLTRPEGLEKPYNPFNFPVDGRFPSSYCLANPERSTV